MKARAITAAMIAALLVAMSAGGALMAHGAVTPNPPLVCSSSQGTTGAAHHAGLVVTFGDGRLPQRFCIGFDADSISGVELLQSSPLPLLLVGGGLGAAVCAIDGVGSANNSSYTTCFDTRPNSWAYFHYTFTDGVGAWAFSNRGAGQSPVKDGDVDGWSWGSGVNTPPVPPDGVFAAAATPTDAPTASQTPAPTATVAPTQAPAPSASAVVSRTPTAPPTRTATSTAAVPSVTATGVDPESTTQSGALTDALSPAAPTHVVSADGASTGTPESAVDAAARTPVVASATARATPTPPSGVVVIDAAQAKENASHAESVTRTDGGGRRSLFLFAGLAVAVIAVGAFVVYRRRQLG